MRTVGEVLRVERERKFYTLDEVEKATKIRIELLEALEAGQYNLLPPQTFVQGFIKNYGRFLGLDIEKLLAVFRREFSEGKNPPRILESFKNPIEGNKFRLTPTRVLISLIFGLIIIFFGYLWVEYRFLVGAPFLEIGQPPDQFNSQSSDLVVSGRTDPEAKVSINNQEITVDQNGKFYQNIKLTDNSSVIAIVATSLGGKQTKIERTVFLKQ